MKKEFLDELPKDITRKLIRKCSKCGHMWMPKIRLNGTVVIARACPNPECGTLRWNTSNA